MYKLFLKPFLFRFEPEKIHHHTVSVLQIVMNTPILRELFSAVFSYRDDRLERFVMGMKFKNPIGLAAGFDKDGKLIEPLAGLGFGFMEIGTVTPLPQDGNEKPRLFRLPKDQALINRMGFNNEGLEAMVKRLKNARKRGMVIGGNIGKNKATPNAHAIKDYQKCFEELFPYVDYFTVNVSSPNTPDLRKLQNKQPLSDLLQLLQMLNYNHPKPKPILLKISPDLNDSQLSDIGEIIRYSNIQGVIATNTTIQRKNLLTGEERLEAIGAGGLSGQPLRKQSTLFIKKLREMLGPRAVIIGVGGIYDADSAIEKLDAGADLVQIYTGLIYEGPGLVKRICKAIANQ